MITDHLCFVFSAVSIFHMSVLPFTVMCFSCEKYAGLRSHRYEGARRSRRPVFRCVVKFVHCSYDCLYCRMEKWMYFISLCLTDRSKQPVFTDCYLILNFRSRAGSSWAACVREVRVVTDSKIWRFVTCQMQTNNWKLLQINRHDGMGSPSTLRTADQTVQIESGRSLKNWRVKGFGSVPSSFGT